MPRPPDEAVTKIAEELATELAKDYDELVNFVRDTLEAQYYVDYDCFVEDWETYVGGPPPVDGD